MYIYFTLACGVSPFLYVLGMSEFRYKVEELFGDAWEGNRKFWRTVARLRKTKIHPVDEHPITPSPSDDIEENRESIL